ncbi:MAG: hypothetical protein V2J51_09380 [Erythrobacter sp.]|jgi:hypothetical protein|nr:hypothetical protein [Erythrobacter sp.]
MSKLFHRSLATVLATGSAIFASSLAAQDWSDPFSGQGAAKSWSKPSSAGMPSMSDVPQGHIAMMDINGFDDPLPAFSFQRPAGFVVQEATIAWSEQPCTGLVPMKRLFLEAQDGRSIRSGGLQGWVNGIDQLRALYAQNGAAAPRQLQNCPDGQVVSADRYLRDVAARSRPGMRIVSARARPDLIEKARRDWEKEKQFATQQTRDAVNRLQFDAAELVIAYNTPNGPVEEYMLTAIGTMRVPDSPVPLTVQAMDGIMSLVAPQGKLRKADLDMIWQTSASLEAYLRIDQQKQTEIERMQDREMEQFRQHTEQRLAAHRQRRSGGRVLRTSGSQAAQSNLMRSASGSSTSAYEGRMAAMDKQSLAQSDATFGTMTVYDAYHGYDVAVEGTDIDVWQTPTGNIFTTDSSIGYDPDTAGVDAVKLSPSSGSSSASSDIGWAITN